MIADHYLSYGHWNVGIDHTTAAGPVSQAELASGVTCNQ